jgi:hypothetical protein
MPALARWLYHLYGEIASRLDDWRHRYDPPLPPVPCQLCGGAHHEAHCPEAKRLGFLD